MTDEYDLINSPLEQTYTVVPEKPFISGQSLMLEEWRSEH